jgi:cobalt-zinc-cadmium efflux system outer membrane protein
MKDHVLIFSLLFLTACVSVPRDTEVASAQWHAEARTADDARARELLGGELTADNAVAIALINNPRLQVELAQLGIARAELMDASTIANPLLEIELRLPGEPHRPYELRLAQSLIDLINLPRRRAIGRIGYDAAKLRIHAAVLRFGAEVRAAYFDVLAESQHVAQDRVRFEAAQAAAEVAGKQHAAENITDLDLENEQARYEQAKLDLARAERRLLVARETLIRAMGIRDASIEWRVPEKFPELPASEMEQPQLEQLAAQQRLDLQIARRELDLAQRRIPVARLAALGDVELDVHYEREPSGEHTVGPGLVVPIPIFNTGRAARTRAEAGFLRARHLVNALTAETSSRLRAAHAALSEARARVEYYRDVVVPRRHRIVELTKLEHNAMFVGVFQLLEARKSAAEAESDSVDAQRDYWTARIDLDRVLHGITGGITTEGDH